MTRRRTATTKLRRTRVTATLVLLAVLASVFVSSPAAAQTDSETPTYVSSAMAVRDTYNRGDSSMYTNLILSYRHTQGDDGRTSPSYTFYESEDGADGSWKSITGGRLSLLSTKEIGDSSLHIEYRHFGLAPGTTRFYRIIATYSNGETSETTTWRAASTLPLPTPEWGSFHKLWGYPGVDDPDNSLQLWWNSTSNVPANLWDHRTYTLQSKNADDTWADVATGLTSARRLHTGLDPETTVTYRVKATISNSAAGWTATESVWSEEFSVTTDPAPPPARPAPPPAPVVSTQLASDKVTLTWPAVTYSDANSSGTVWYTVEHLGSSGWQVLSERQTGLTYEHTGRTAGTKDQEYLVSAVVKLKDVNEYVTGSPSHVKVDIPAAGGSGDSGPSQEASPVQIVPRFSLGDIRPPQNPLDDQTGVGGASDQSSPAVSFVIYHDPDAGSVSVNRYNQAITLLSNAGISYTVVSGDVRDEASRLAGVTRSVMPRFFLGDPTESGWTSELKGNNGGLRWLKKKTQELSG